MRSGGSEVDLQGSGGSRDKVRWVGKRDLRSHKAPQASGVDRWAARMGELVYYLAVCPSIQGWLDAATGPLASMWTECKPNVRKCLGSAPAAGTGNRRWEREWIRTMGTASRVEREEASVTDWWHSWIGNHVRRRVCLDESRV